MDLYKLTYGKAKIKVGFFPENRRNFESFVRNNKKKKDYGYSLVDEKTNSKTWILEQRNGWP